VDRLFGLIASFHGIIMGYSRQIFALSRAGFLPRVLATVHPKRKTPHWAILAGGLVGIAAIFSDNLITIGGQPLTANIVTMSVFGAIVMYIMSMASLFRLRAKEPGLERPYKAPLYPFFPALSLVLAVLSFATMVYYNFTVFVLFIVLFAAGWLYFHFTAHRREEAERDTLLVTAAAD